MLPKERAAYLMMESDITDLLTDEYLKRLLKNNRTKRQTYIKEKVPWVNFLTLY